MIIGETYISIDNNIFKHISCLSLNDIIKVNHVDCVKNSTLLN